MTPTGPHPVTLDHVGIAVASLARPRRFYADVLGFSTVEDAFTLPAAGIRGLVLVNGAGARVELFERRDCLTASTGHPTERTRQTGLFHFAVAVADACAAFARTTGAGASVVMAPQVAPDGQCVIAFVGDPDGNLIELVERH